MKKRILCLLAFFAINLMAKEEIKLGLILPLTGENESIGEECKVGIQILENELKQKETAFDYKFLIEDDQMLPKQTAMAVQKLLQLGKVNGVFPVYSAAGNVCKPFCEKAEVPMVSIGSWDTNIPDGKYCFIDAARIDNEAILFLTTMKELGYKRLALLNVIQQGALAARKNILEHAKEYGIEVVSDEHYVSGERDFRTLWLRIKESKPDLVLIQAMDPEFGIILKHRLQAGVGAPIASMEWFSATNCLPELESEITWQTGGTIGVYKTGFYKKVFAIDPRIKSFLNAGYAHDSVGIVVNAFEGWASVHKTGKPSGREVVQLIHELSYNGALGRSRVDRAGVIDSDVGLWVVDKDGMKPIDVKGLKAIFGK